MLQEAARPIRGSPYVNTSAYFHPSSSSVNLPDLLLNLSNLLLKLPNLLLKLPNLLLRLPTKIIVCISLSVLSLLMTLFTSQFAFVHLFTKVGSGEVYEWESSEDEDNNNDDNDGEDADDSDALEDEQVK